MSGADVRLPAGVVVLERGWLSSNNVLLLGPERADMVDSGYGSHSDQTLALVEHACAGRTLATLVNTHLHSDHCGGNAALQARYRDLLTLIPPGLAEAVRAWDEVALTYRPTGQSCPRFGFQGLVQPGSSIELGDKRWEVHAAPGHDPHSILLLEPESRTLISADALWENGFGVVFPELEGAAAFDEVAATLDLIEQLTPSVVIPGHGRVFTDARSALATARRRLDAYRSDPSRHARHAAKVLIKFRLLEWQAVSWEAFMQWSDATVYLRMVQERFFEDIPARRWIEELVDELVRSGAARLEDGVLYNA
ncbi:MBL fold metallo-hydrolase [Ramlibacter ginsenosidimutans]|uniref:MBL fold metallo-hydrolase n=1 Tax=Ramlibacter ginsenosidimutans TaxID=502333 RepID=A0A934TSM2_9BURK|nr:MBL fold metallo-hydrolase [Ramlibacter ginsenosidimutans]MBK6006190.1 MBL fold metallo-hydrolase [Ramlibacter ginsenosidimutans]